MKKVMGFILAFVLVIGLAFGIQQVVSSRSHAPTTSRQAASSSRASSQKQPEKKKANPKAKQHRSKQKTAKKASNHGNTNHQATGKSTNKNQSGSPKATKAVSKSANSNKPAATKQTAKTPKDDKLGKINHQNETKVVKSHAKPTSKSANPADTIRIHLRVDGYKKVFYAKTMRVKKHANAFSILKQTNLKISYIPGHSVYVNGINGLRENDIKAGSGWMFSVNHKFIDHAANLTPLKNGDQVHWYFTTQGY
ncbi:hypothetical protein YK48G_12790 [Lentilactobacillus fungorum]|uniref:Transcobalamin-like C-terminal domain-containing protein n=1 Tax=Lentilactobacillus fungorum TaxID=2201250 RepID=A0ABQ3W2G8_9LACO|nr:DUF4430 domain-containing protein [Lentilactobacillus fungorum]GHP13854.1 hypothetical protein YK48G_12790 [Lentilactobacillus fungorum]